MLSPPTDDVKLSIMELNLLASVRALTIGDLLLDFARGKVFVWSGGGCRRDVVLVSRSVVLPSLEDVLCRGSSSGMVPTQV